MKFCFRLFLIVVLLNCLPAERAFAQNQHSNQARGFDANGVYSSTEIDSVNLFNGNLILSIPVGGPQKVSGGLSYSLALFYNSNLWNHQEVCPVNVSYKVPVWTTTDASGNIVITDPPNDSQEPNSPRSASSGCYTMTEPNPEANAGMGWQLSLGKLFPPRYNESDGDRLKTEKQNWVYVAPDGSEHSFYARPHQTDPQEPGDGDPATDPVTYTRDGSYLRMKIVGGDRHIEFPEGYTHVFHNFSTNGALVDWRLTRMQDQFNNYVNVTYPAGQWVLADNHGRTQRVIFQKLAADFPPVVTEVQLTAFGNTTASYLFSYVTQTVERASPYVHDLPGYSSHVQVPFLVALTLPDASQYTMPLYNSYDLDGSYSSSRLRGVIRGVTLPTGGRIEWEYSGAPGIPTVDEQGRRLWYGYPIVSSARGYSRSSIGVRRRKVIESGVTYVWQYDPRPEPSSNPGSTDPAYAPKQFVNKVTSPEGNYTLHYFSFYPFPLEADRGRTPSEWHVSEYGLPITKYASVTDSKGLPVFLSQQVFAAGASESNPLRSTYLRYETDTIPANNGYGNIVDTNRRVVAQRTVYHDDGGRYAETQQSQYDGLGHYRRTDTAGNFGVGDVRTMRINYNPARGTYLISPNTNNPDTGQPAPLGHNYQAFPIGDPWVLGTYDSTVQSEGGQAARVLFHFSNTGLLLRKRVVKNGGSTAPVGANDVVVKYDYTNGELTSEQYHGGSYQTLDTTQPLDVMPLPAAEYRIDHTYQYGVLKTSKPKDSAGNALPEANYKTVDMDVDKNTGLPGVVRDLSRDPVAYSYDKMNRLTDIEQRQGSWTHIDYAPSNGTSLAKATVYHRPHDGGTALDQEEYVYDPMGRLTVERKQMPGGSFMERTTKYNGSGWKTSVSEWGSAAKKTQFQLFDPFGRAQKIIPPDGSGHVSWLTYSGVREVKRTVKTATSASLEEDTDTVERYDIHGRLTSVEEYSDYTTAAPRSVTTFYSYDVGNRLKLVSTTANGVTQTRRFTYDNRGFLASETHPELGVSGNGTISYPDYDSRGHLRLKTDGSNTLRYNIDRAERLAEVQECLAGTPCSIFNASHWRPLKQYEYYTDDPSANGLYRLGKLRATTRHNWIVNPNTGSPVDVTIAVTSDYWGLDGRVSQRTTATSTGATFQQNFTFDQLGNLATQTYPQCLNSTCVDSGAAKPRTLTYTYQKGLLTQVTSGAVNYAKAITYNLNGTINTIAHGVTGNTTDNGVVDTQTMDPNHMPRPRQISTSGANLNWNSGLYSYDGAGNVKLIGADWYVYDKANRLVEGTAAASSNPAEKRKQRYTYDPFGNIKTKVTYAYVGTPGETVTENAVWDVASGTNRFNGLAYDGSGNLRGPAATQPYAYDAVNMMKTSPGKIYLYNADDERVWIYDHSSGNPASYTDTFTLRGLNNEVLREYTTYGGNAVGRWSWAKDYVYMGSNLLASEEPSGRLNYHVDHLGTPRLVTNNARQVVSSHQYLPFGEEATGGGGGRLKFTGHERDFNYSPGHTIDYLHGRYYGFAQTKFLSVDPGRDFDPQRPQSWNMYAYVRNNPLGARDPNGRALDTVLDVASIGYDLFDIGRSVYKGEQVSRTQWLALGADVAMAAIPFATGGGIAVRTAAKTAKVVERPAIILGETMERVKQVKAITGMKTFDAAWSGMKDQMAMNVMWLKNKIDSGHRIFDIGIDLHRRKSKDRWYKDASKFVAAEVQVLQDMGYVRRFTGYYVDIKHTLEDGTEVIRRTALWEWVRPGR